MEPETTTQPSEEAPRAIEGEASEVPSFFFWALWVPVVAVVAWGLMLAMGRRPWQVGEDDGP